MVETTINRIIAFVSEINMKEKERYIFLQT